MQIWFVGNKYIVYKLLQIIMWNIYPDWKYFDNKLSNKTTRNSAKL